MMLVGLGEWVEMMGSEIVEEREREGGRVYVCLEAFWGVGRRHCWAEPRTDSERSHGQGCDLELVTKY